MGGWVQGSRGGANKGQAGDLGDACLAEPRRRSRRFPLSARGMREEEGDPDERARRVGGGAGKRGAGEQRRQVGPGAQGERATRGGERAGGGKRCGVGAAACWVARRAGEWAERWRVARGKSERGWRAGPGARVWAARRVGRGLRKKRERGLGRPGWVLGWVWFPFSILFLSSFQFLIQTKFKFKYKFEFKPHSIKSMHQHECNTNF